MRRIGHAAALPFHRLFHLLIQEKNRCEARKGTPAIPPLFPLVPTGDRFPQSVPERLETFGFADGRQPENSGLSAAITAEYQRNNSGISENEQQRQIAG
jgi:hypothetical protein